MSFRILLPYVGDRYGGSNESSLVMAEALKQRGHEPIVVTHGEGRVVDEAGRRGLKVVTLPRLSAHPSYERASGAHPEQLLATPECLKALRALRPNIIHTNDLTMLRSWALPSFLSRTTLIAHWRAASRVSLSLSSAFAAASRVVSVSAYSKEFLPGWVQRKTTVEFNSLEVYMNEGDRIAARAATREQLDLPADAVLIGVFGNFAKRKRSHVLADILQALEVTSDGRPIYGLLCGGKVEPLDTELFVKRDAYELQNRLLMPGFVRPVHQWMAACDVILAPAEREPLARNILEALALGVPVIVSSDGGLTEIVSSETNGIVLAPADLDGWIAAVRRLLEDPALAKRLADAGQESVRALAPSRHAERIEALYESACKI